MKVHILLVDFLQKFRDYQIKLETEFPVSVNCLFDLNLKAVTGCTDRNKSPTCSCTILKKLNTPVMAELWNCVKPDVEVFVLEINGFNFSKTSETVSFPLCVKFTV